MTPASAPDDLQPLASAFTDQTVVFSGRLLSLGRREARAVVERLGGTTDSDLTSRTTMLVVGEETPVRGVASPLVGSTAVAKSQKLKKAEAVNTKSPGRIRILSEDEFCERAGLPCDQSLRRHYQSGRQVRDLYPFLRESHLRHLEKWGLVRPVARTRSSTYYTFNDVAVLKQINEELEQHRSFQSAVRGRLAAREGQLALDFGSVRSEATPAKVVALRRREATKVTSASAAGPGPTDGVQSALAARFFTEGAELDEGDEGDRERARMAYRKALLLDPNLVPAIVNLANLHYANDDLVEAQALYGRALSLDPECFEAHFNLGNIHHDLGRYQGALGCYHEALQLNPRYADAHFYLAVTLEKMGRSRDAKTHWRHYQRLAPDGEWVDLAREFSE